MNSFGDYSRLQQAGGVHVVHGLFESLWVQNHWKLFCVIHVCHESVYICHLYKTKKMIFCYFCTLVSRFPNISQYFHCGRYVLGTRFVHLCFRLAHFRCYSRKLTFDSVLLHKLDVSVLPGMRIPNWKVGTRLYGCQNVCNFFPIIYFSLLWGIFCAILHAFPAF